MARAFTSPSSKRPIGNAGEPIAEDDDLFGTSINLAALKVWTVQELTSDSVGIKLLTRVCSSH